MDKVISEIEHRLYIASRGQRNTDMWCYPDINLSAPDGVDYDDWIDHAMVDASEYIGELKAKINELEYKTQSTNKTIANGIKDMLQYFANEKNTKYCTIDRLKVGDIIKYIEMLNGEGNE